MKKTLAIILAFIGIFTVVAFTLPHNTNLFNKRNDWITKLESNKELANSLGYTADTKYYYLRETLRFNDGEDHLYPNARYIHGTPEYDEANIQIYVDFKREVSLNGDLVIVNQKELKEKTGADFLQMPRVKNSIKNNNSKAITVGDYVFVNRPEFTRLTSDDLTLEGLFDTVNSDNSIYNTNGEFSEEFNQKPFFEKAKLFDSCVQMYNLKLEKDLAVATDGSKEIIKRSITTPKYSTSTVESTQSTSEESTSSEQTTSSN